jgi:Rrf2 family iron-sulfur cluster assembly transcriptional regulator
MRLTTKGRYAVTAMLDLALHSSQGPVNLAEISLRQKISLPYLEQLFSKLRRASLVASVRGPGGGYELNRVQEALFVSEIIDAVDESLDTTKCKGRGDCKGGVTCLTHYLWTDLSKEIHGFLSGISLADLVTKTEAKQVAEGQDWQKIVIEEGQSRAVHV